MFLELFAQNVKNHPDMIAISWQEKKKEQTFTYLELDCRSTQLAHHFRNLDINPVDSIYQNSIEEPIIAIRSSRNNPYWIICILASWKVGAAIVLLDKSLSLQECNRRIKDLDTGCKIIIDDEDNLFTDKETNQDRKFININNEIVTYEFDSKATQQIAVSLDPHYLAYIAYTSSTSSVDGAYSKAVAINHEAAEPVIDAYKKAMKIQTGDRMLQASSFHFDPCMAEVFCLAINDSPITLVLPPDPQRLLIDLPQVIKEQKINLLTAVPAVLEQHINELKKPLRHIVSTGEAGSEALFKQLRGQGVNVSNGYGPTEHGIGSTLALNSTNCIGNPMLGKEIFLCTYDFPDEPQETPIFQKLQGKLISFHQLKNGDKGEIVIAGKGLARGYISKGTIDNEQTKKSFDTINDPLTNKEIKVYFTGDIGAFENGGLQCKGRLDNQFKISGVRLETLTIGDAVKAAITKLAGQSKFTNIIIVPQRTKLENNRTVVSKIVCFIIINNNANLELDVVSIRNQIINDASLPDIAIPTCYYLLPESIINDKELRTPGSSKIRYNKLATLLEKRYSNFLISLKQLPYSSFSTAIILEEHLSATEEKIINICKKILGFKDKEYPFTLATNLADYGVTSIHTIRLKQILANQFLINMDLPPYFTGNLTIKQLVAYVVRKKLFQVCFNLVSSEALVQTPIFCVHPLAGDCSNFSQLKITTNHSLYGLTSPYVLELYQPDKAQELKEFVYLYIKKYECTTIEEIASFVIYGMQKIQPVGPYYIAGHSAGGNIAIAMAELLMQYNGSIQWLGLFDPPFPGFLGQSLTSSNESLENLIEIINIIGKGMRITFKLEIDEIYQSANPRYTIEKLFKKVKKQLEEYSQSMLPNKNNQVKGLDSNIANAKCIYLAMEKHLMALIKYECITPITNIKKARLYSTFESGMLSVKEHNAKKWTDIIPKLKEYQIENNHIQMLSNMELHERLNSDLAQQEAAPAFVSTERSNLESTSSNYSTFTSAQLGNSRQSLFFATSQTPTVQIEHFKSKTGIEANAVTESPSIVISNVITEGALKVNAITSNITEAQGSAVSMVMNAIRKNG